MADLNEAVERGVRNALEKPNKYLGGRSMNQVLIGFAQGEIVPVVRCRDCKHRPTDNRGVDDDYTAFAIQFPDERCPCQCEDGWYNWYPPDDWFCANGEQKEG